MTTRQAITPGFRSPVVSRAPAVRVPALRGIPWSTSSKTLFLFGDYWHGAVPAVGSKVTEWYDASGSGGVATQATVARQPTYGIDGNGRGYVEFLGAQELRTNYQPFLAGPFTWLLVSQSYSTTAQRFVGAVGSATLSDGFGFCRTSTPTRGLVYELVGTVSAGTATLLPEAVVITRASSIPTATSRAWVRSGGVTTEQTLVPSTVNLLSPTGGLVVGSRANSTARWLGTIYALVAMQYAASDALVADLLGWAGEYYSL